MKSSIYLLGLIAAASAIDLNLDLFGKEWNAFKLKFGKTYKNILEESSRRINFMENKQKIAIHNGRFELGLVSYQLGMNQFGDMTHQEFISTMTGYSFSSDSARNKRSVTLSTFANNQLPTAVDWRDKGAVTPVKDQGNCISGWAFSTTGSLEGQHFLHYGALVSLSEQNLVDCSLPYGNLGCGGGLMDNAFKYIEANGGIDSEKSYPYIGFQGICSKRNTVVTITGFVDIPVGNEDKLQEAVANVGPVSVGIDATHVSFMLYNNGVYYEPICSSAIMNHALTVVGYGIDGDSQEPYWLAKNSWGTEWGDNGYIKIARNKTNHCGIATIASYPLV